jgi:hypothetical protein
VSVDVLPVARFAEYCLYCTQSGSVEILITAAAILPVRKTKKAYNYCSKVYIVSVGRIHPANRSGVHSTIPLYLITH